MKSKPTAKSKKDGKQNLIPVRKAAPVEPKKKLTEISEESLAERQLLDKMFSANADAKAESDKRRRKAMEATITLLDGRETNIIQIHERFTSKPLPYKALFPNDNPFFANALRMHGLDHIDPRIYIKPKCIRAFILHAIYNRFPKSKELMRAINAVNPILPSGFRVRKLSQHVDIQGREQIEQYREDANKIMAICHNEYECKEKLHSEHGVPYQTDVFKKGKHD